ncbi:MAG: flagellar hook-length control protein FliK [bacterium]|nr:flagellar hook-length control protein FliK [bacterium]
MPASVRRQVVARLAGELPGLGGKGVLRLQLTPPQLGRVEVSFERVGQELQLTFRVETAEAARALREGAHELTAALLDKQAGWDRVKVDVEREEPEEHDDGRDDHRGRDGRRDRDERDGEEGART